MAGSKGIKQSANVYLVLSMWSLGLRGEGTRAGINRKTKGINVKVQSWSSSRAAEGPRNVLELPYRDPPCASYGDLETSPRPGTEEEWGPFRPVLCPGLRHVAFGRFGIVLGQFVLGQFVTDQCEGGGALRLKSEALAQVARQDGSKMAVFFCGI